MTISLIKLNTIRLGRRRANKDTDFASPGSIPEKVNNFCPPVIRHLIRNSLPKATFIHSIELYIISLFKNSLAFLRWFLRLLVAETARRRTSPSFDFCSTLFLRIVAWFLDLRFTFAFFFQFRFLRWDRLSISSYSVSGFCDFRRIQSAPRLEGCRLIVPLGNGTFFFIRCQDLLGAGDDKSVSPFRAFANTILKFSKNMQ